MSSSWRFGLIGLLLLTNACERRAQPTDWSAGLPAAHEAGDFVEELVLQNDGDARPITALSFSQPLRVQCLADGALRLVVLDGYAGESSEKQSPIRFVIQGRKVAERTLIMEPMPSRSGAFYRSVLDSRLDPSLPMLLERIEREGGSLKLEYGTQRPIYGVKRSSVLRTFSRQCLSRSP